MKTSNNVHTLFWETERVSSVADTFADNSWFLLKLFYNRCDESI